MIEISGKTFLVTDEDGRAAPFDPDLLHRRIEEAIVRTAGEDPDQTADIADAIEYAMLSRLKAVGSRTIPAAEVDLLAGRMLETVGCRAAAELFRRAAGERVPFLVDITRIRAFLEKELPMPEEELDRITRKVFNTLQSIGGDTSSGQLIVELARHFRARTAEKVRDTIRFPPIVAGENRGFVVYSDYAAALSPATAEAVAKRQLVIHRIDLRIFPSLRIDLRLGGLPGELIPPLTELSLAPALVRTAEAVDAIALAADEACARKGSEKDTPLPLILHFTDAGSFTRKWMDCGDAAGCAQCAESLAQTLCTMLSRQPIRFTCQ